MRITIERTLHNLAAVLGEKRPTREGRSRKEAHLSREMERSSFGDLTQYPKMTAEVGWPGNNNKGIEKKDIFSWPKK